MCRNKWRQAATPHSPSAPPKFPGAKTTGASPTWYWITPALPKAKTFWWGHFFSSTLQLAGSFKEGALWKLATAYSTLAEQDFYIGIQQDPWQHHFEETNYQKISSLSKEDFFSLLQQQPHTKIAARWPLSQWDAAANLLVDSWKTLLNLIA